MKRLSYLLIPFGLIVLWQLAAMAVGGASYILPGPLPVAGIWWERLPIIMDHAWITFAEILLGLLLGAVMGIGTALLMASSSRLFRWILPVLVVSQAIPVFALAPILVLWLGYGLASKVAVSVIVIFFPVATAFLDGLRRADSGWVELARTMNARPLSILIRIRLPAALPALASGLRVATAVAPIGAVIGEWVGSSAGLGYLMLQANARMQIPLVFAALLTLALFSVGLYLAVDMLLRRAIPWQADNLFSESGS